MCDYYFYQRMENNDGDLADIFRNSSLAGRQDQRMESSSNLPGRENSWQLLPDQPAASFPLQSDTLGDPFPNTRDPLLHELAAASFFDSPETVAVMASGGGGAQKLLFGDEGKRPSNNIFSRMSQISPGTCNVSQVIGPQQLMSPGGGAPVDHGGGVQISLPRMSGIKRRKGQAKKVVCIPAPAAASGRPSGESVPSDLWAWRKYGQKPIKGSPYPRGYYRCSSSKGCSARKQVERSRTDPNMLVITYTSEHNHPWPTQRNALAGSTRSQPPKANNSSSSKKSSPQNEKQLITNMKTEEPKECSSSSTPVVKEEAQEMEKALFDHDFDRVFDESFKEHMISDPNQPDDFFADLAELEQDPMNLIFPKGFMGDHKLDDERDKNNNKAMDPFNVFDWGGGSTFGDAKRGL